MANRIADGQDCFANDLHEKMLTEFIGFELKTESDLKIKINDLEYKSYFEMPGCQKIEAKTVYPGLLIGTGYSHPALEDIKDPDPNKNQGDYQLGFYFDHTTGMPVIPGASVKGKLKSVFPKEKDLPDVVKNKKKQIKNWILEYAKGEITELQADAILNNWEDVFFGGKQIFFDAYVTKVEDFLYNDDYITPHRSKGRFKNPTPIRFLKIASGVTFNFQFRLKESNTDKYTFKIENKLDVFTRIIRNYGMGAKTNTGYGYFNEFKRN